MQDPLFKNTGSESRAVNQAWGPVRPTDHTPRRLAPAEADGVRHTHTHTNKQAKYREVHFLRGGAETCLQQTLILRNIDPLLSSFQKNPIEV